jgi:hypothetical protein
MDLIFNHWLTLVVAGVFTWLQELQSKPGSRVSGRKSKKSRRGSAAAHPATPKDGATRLDNGDVCVFVKF